MKKIGLMIILVSLAMSFSYASKLSRFFHEHKERERAREQQQLRQDMNFADFSFRFEKRYVDERGEQCRDYVFRSRSNPYRHGYFTVCEER
ncbi:hypothetical protein [Legionella israelensis]|uniref:Uncharacterized protein n=1 Tax=Legionella israelensis TaxID=454 RepID=A0A0W0WG83_9GAMM|nr:hypothetical protein [Legionella israelensis]KTD31356.1 hypothetical protein Lisr_0667 [Legionella israelensis]QBS09841.1 hypothetical protein E4T55_08195 [Legionella israelensis]SCY13818.1 hypothetical protein SAMN02746069_01417 [Legionella israelensis DSM 19235]STX59399.1 Uncharacterised protein [Legionella israelensis]